MSVLLSDVKRLCVLFAVATVAGVGLIFATAGLGGYAGTALQNIGAALFTAGLIAFPLAIVGHSELTRAARSNLQRMQDASADKILEERLSKQHIKTLREDTFGKLVLEQLKFLITLHPDETRGDVEPGITLVFEREYSATNYEAAPKLIDLVHHMRYPLNPLPADRTARFTYVYLDMDDGRDSFEWDPEADPAWTQPADRRSGRKWRDGEVSLGREPGLDDIVTLRAQGITLDPGSTMRAKIISEKAVSIVGSEPFGVSAPATELDVEVRCSADTKVYLFPLHTPFNAFEPRSHVSARKGQMQRISWRWDRALFPGQYVLLRWISSSYH
jgi:hypothetical protein